MPTPTSRPPPVPFAPIVALGRCFFLVIVLLAMLVVQPLLPRGEGDEPGLAARLLFALVPLAAVYALSGRRWTLTIAIVLAVPALITHVVPSPAEQSILDTLRLPMSLLFACFVTGVTIGYALTSKAILRDRLFAAASAYLMLGLTFAVAYQLVDAIAGPALAFQGQPAVRVTWADLQYFSFSTLTTAGYGDFTPLSGVTRGLANVEAVMGVMFIAVLVARLVGEAAAETRIDESNRRA